MQILSVICKFAISLLVEIRDLSCIISKSQITQLRNVSNEKMGLSLCMADARTCANLIVPSSIGLIL